MKYKNILFDLYGTLVDIHTDEESENIWEKMCLFYGYHQVYYTAGKMRNTFEKLVKKACKNSGEIRIEDIFRQLFTEKGVSPDEETVFCACRTFRILTTEYIRLYPGTEKFLEKLRGQGRKLYLLTNAQRVFTWYELRMLGLDKYFDDICISSDYWVKKPDTRFFQALLDKCRLIPEECLMVGNDEICDIGGAKKAGLDSIYLHTNLSPDYTGKAGAEWMVMKQPEDMEEVLQAITALEEGKQS